MASVQIRWFRTKKQRDDFQKQYGGVQTSKQEHIEAGNRECVNYNFYKYSLKMTKEAQ